MCVGWGAPTGVAAGRAVCCDVQVAAGRGAPYARQQLPCAAHVLVSSSRGSGGSSGRERSMCFVGWGPLRCDGMGPRQGSRKTAT
jgi:hypothetical protein